MHRSRSITGRTSYYLWDAKNSGLQAKKGVVTVQSHEVAHQWFGNITTMEWWDNLWLKCVPLPPLGLVLGISPSPSLEPL